MKKALIYVMLVVFMCGVPVLSAMGSDSYARWKYQQPITAAEDGLSVLQLNKAVLRHARQDLNDVRLTDTAGKTLPYEVLRAREHFADTLIADVIDKGVIGSEYTVLTLDMKRSGLMHNKITLNVYSKKDYMREVTIEASNDNISWTTIGRDKILSLTPKYYKDYLDYPTSSQRYIRLKIPLQGEKPLEVMGAEVFFKGAEPIRPLKLGMDLKQSGPVADAKSKTTSYMIDLGTKGLDVHYVIMRFAAQNYDRSVDFYSSNNKTDWTMITAGRIFHYKWPDYEAWEDTLKVYAPSGRYFKIVTHDLDSPSLQSGSIEVWGSYPRLLTDVARGQYVLRYGNTEAMKPDYDLSRFSDRVDVSKLPVLKAGTEKANAQYSKSVSERFPWLLNTAIILAALVLGLIIVRNMKGSSQ